MTKPDTIRLTQRLLPSAFKPLGAVILLALSMLACGNAADASRNPQQPSGEIAPGPSLGGPTSPASDILPTQPTGSLPSTATSLGLDVNQYLFLSTDNTGSASVALGSRYASAARVSLTDAQKKFLASPTQTPSIPTSGLDSELSYQVFDVTLYPSNGNKPSPIDVIQHSLSNCDGDAALAALAYGHGDFIQRIIHATGSNTWNVDMVTPGGAAITVAVDDHFVAIDGKLTAVSGRNRTANWATVLEKALMKYNAIYKISGPDGIAGTAAIGSEHALPMFTASGVSYAFDRGVLSPQQLRDEVRNALGNGMMVTGGFGKVANVDGYQTVTGHAYTVLWPKDEATMVSMRNPWGLASNVSTGSFDSAADGVINIPLDPQWAATIDLRVIAPGQAGPTAAPAPYHPEKSRRATPLDAEMIDRPTQPVL